MRTVIGRNQKVGVWWTIGSAFVFRSQKLIVKRLLQCIPSPVAELSDNRRDLNLVLYLTRVSSSLMLCRASTDSIHCTNQLSQVLNFVEALRRGNRTARILDSGG